MSCESNIYWPEHRGSISPEQGSTTLCHRALLSSSHSLCLFTQLSSEPLTCTSTDHNLMFHCPTSRQEHVSLICSLCSFNHCLGLLTDTDHLVVHLMNETSTLTQGSIRKLINPTRRVLHHVQTLPTVKSHWSSPYQIYTDWL